MISGRLRAVRRYRLSFDWGGPFNRRIKLNRYWESPCTDSAQAMEVWGSWVRTPSAGPVRYDGITVTSKNGPASLITLNLNVSEAVRLPISPA